MYKKITFIGTGLLCLFITTVPAQQQETLASYTPAVEQPLRRDISLPGTTESPLKSVLASEIAALVTELKVREGETVRKGDELIRLQTRPLQLQLQSVKAQLEEAKARSGLAKRNYDRSVDLMKSKTISEQQMDESKYEFDAWQARIHNLGAEMERINYDMTRSRITAPFDGIISARHTEMGQWSDVGDPLLEIISMEVLEVHVDVPERYFSYLATGMGVDVSLDHMTGKNYSTYIRAIIPQADAQAHSFPIKLRFRDNNPEIAAGMLARVQLSVGEERKAIMVPKDALVRQGSAQLVYVIGADNSVSPVPVQPAAAMGVWIEVQGDIKAGDKVVTRGNERLQPGQKVKAVVLEYPPP